MGTPIGALFLDSCILLNRILGENPQRTTKLFHDMFTEDIECFLSTSVYGECDRKITQTIDYIGGSFRGIFQGAFGFLLEGQNRTVDDTFQQSDILLIQNIFRNIVGQDEVLNTPSSILEEFIVHVAESRLKKGEIFSFKDLVLGLTLEIMRLTNTLNDKYENLFLLKNPKLNIFTDLPNSSLISELLNAGIHEPDNIHLASSKEYENKTSNKTVFVTDDNGILRKMDYIKNRWGIRCSDPLYAIHHLS